MVATKKSKSAVASATTLDRVVPQRVQGVMVLAVVGGLFFIRPFFGVILLSALIAFVFNPVYKAVLRRAKSQGLALTATIFVAILSFMLPVFLVTAITVSQASSLISTIEDESANIGPAQIETVTARGADRIDDLVRALPGGESFHIDKQKLSNDLQKIGVEVVQGLINFIKSAAGAFFGVFSSLILSFFLIIAMLRYQIEFVAFIKKLSPFHDNVTNVYLRQAGAMTKAMVKGQLIIAVAQGFASAGSLWLVGLDYFWFFFVILTFLSFIPLGAGIVTIPIGVVIMLTGNVAQGLFVILFHILGVSNIDNLLRPRLVPKTARLNSALTLLAVFSGLAVFGAPGVIYGPVLMILLITTFQMYADYNSQVEKPLPPSYT